MAWGEPCPSVNLVLVTFQSLSVLALGAGVNDTWKTEFKMKTP